MIAVAQNDRDRALEDARRAVELSPQSAAARIALSYAEQARFQIEAARQAMQQAVEDEPENPLAWARLSELWLMQGRRDRARRAAKRARELAPDLARVQTVLGFAELAEINTAKAKKAFRRAIAIDSANPLPRFGLGLATIRAGDLEGGRKEIEIAVALDPENALLRSYLGKAYFDERTTNPLTYLQELVTNFPNQENTLAAQQFAISKQLDPNDPTPWLYDAIRLQSENRPVEALRNIEKSIELNDNRAVFRSRELLDQDRAARGTSLARIYNDLGFEQLGINEATKSLSLDPDNAGAHRFLSDVYATQPRREIARVSELLQAQLLQDININPVQPSLSETNLGIITSGGPARPGFNEFTPLFERNQAQLNVSGVVGSDWTRGEEAVVSGIYDNISLSAGQFHYQSDGFRKNFDLNHDIYDFFAQAAITPKLNLQAEFRKRHSEEGDRALDFDPKDFSEIEHQEVNQDTSRVGLRLSPSAKSDFIVSLIDNERDFRNRDEAVDTRSHSHTIQSEAQYLLRTRHLYSVAGFSTSNVDIDGRQASSFFPQVSLDQTVNKNSAYLYTNIRYPLNVVWTFGLSHDQYEQGGEADLNLAENNPKLGVQWYITDRVTLRLAAFRSVKPALTTNQTIEPTQVAGFNQFFDDINGTVSWRYGIGLDLRPTESISSGAEFSVRDLDQPFERQTTDIKEQSYLAYVYWTLNERWVLGVEPRYDVFDRDRRGFGPTRLETLSVPLSIRYFSPAGLFGATRFSFIHQDVNRPAPSVLEGSDNFTLVDAVVGYRLPNRRGILSVEGLNLSNANFHFQDDRFRQVGAAFPTISPFIPERSVLARLTFSF